MFWLEAVSLKVVGQTAAERPGGVGQSIDVPSCVEGAAMEGERGEQGGCEGEVWAWYIGRNGGWGL